MGSEKPENSQCSQCGCEDANSNQLNYVLTGLGMQWLCERCNKTLAEQLDAAGAQWGKTGKEFGDLLLRAINNLGRKTSQ